MKRLASFLLALLVTLASIGGARAQPSVELLNPGFEGEFVTPASECADASAYLPLGWTPYCGDGGAPEFTTMSALNFPYRVRSGETALKYFAFARIQKSAGVYQRVSVPSGQWLEFSAWVQIWTSDCLLDPPSSFYEPGNLEARVCVDTDGGALDWDSGTVCSHWVREGAWDKYTQISVNAQAQSEEVLVLVNSRNEWAVRFNDVYVDDVELTAIDVPTTSLPMTSTVYVPFAVHDGWVTSPTWPRGPDDQCGWPTATPVPTDVPGPVETPAPDGTATPQPRYTRDH